MPFPGIFHHYCVFLTLTNNIAIALVAWYHCIYGWLVGGTALHCWQLVSTSHWIRPVVNIHIWWDRWDSPPRAACEVSRLLIVQNLICSTSSTFRLISESWNRSTECQSEIFAKRKLCIAIFTTSTWEKWYFVEKVASLHKRSKKGKAFLLVVLEESVSYLQVVAKKRLGNWKLGFVVPCNSE